MQFPTLCPTLCWYEVDYSVFVMRQASRRSWRIGQTEPVKVVFMAYRNTLQASLAVEGELPADGLAAFGDDGDDLMLALARRPPLRSSRSSSRPGRSRRSPRRC